MRWLLVLSCILWLCTGCADKKLLRTYEAQVHTTEAVTRARLCDTECRQDDLCSPPAGDLAAIQARINAEVAALCPCISAELCSYLQEMRR